MYIITHTIDGIEVHKKSLPMGTYQELIDASEYFHNLVHDAIENHIFTKDGQGDESLNENLISDEVIDHYENSGEILLLEDVLGKAHAFQMSRERS